MRALGKYLERTGLTQAAFAQQVGVTQTAISDLVNGKANASTSLLKRICRATGLSADELLADEAPPQADTAAA